MLKKDASSLLVILFSTLDQNVLRLFCFMSSFIISDCLDPRPEGRSAPDKKRSLDIPQGHLKLCSLEVVIPVNL
jgi:hypothetical protein